MKTSLFTLAGLPGEFGVTLLLFSFILLLTPYFSGSDFGILKIPKLSLSSKKKLKYAGPLAISLAIALQLPFFPAFDFEPTHVVR